MVMGESITFILHNLNDLLVIRLIREIPYITHEEIQGNI